MRWTIGLALAGLVACSGGAETPSGPTLEQITSAQSQVHGFQPWDQAETTLKTAAGEPTSVEGDVYKWVAHEGDKCHTLTVTRMVTTVGSVTLEETPCP
jgi:hypothetical protein